MIKSKIDINEIESGAFDFHTRALEENEKKYYGIFISHSSCDNENYLYPLRDEMRKRGLHPLCDRDFLSGGENYQIKIAFQKEKYFQILFLQLEKKIIKL